MYNPYIPQEYWAEYNVSYFSSLKAGIISSLLTGLITGLLVWFISYSYQNRAKEANELIQAEKDFSMFVQQLKLKLNLHDAVIITSYASGWLPYNISESMKLIFEHPLEYWSSKLTSDILKNLEIVVNSYQGFITVSSHMDYEITSYLAKKEHITQYKMDETKELIYGLINSNDPKEILPWTTEVKNLQDMKKYTDMLDRIQNEFPKLITNYQESKSTLKDNFNYLITKL